MTNRQVVDSGSLGLATEQSAFSRCCVIHWDVVDARFTPGFHKNW